MLPFIRSDLAQLVAYTPHPGSTVQGSTPSVPVQVVDRLDTNESPYDLPPELKQKLAWLYQNELEANRYPDGGHQQLKRAIAHYANISAQTLWVQPENITVGNGSDELIRSLLIATCLGGEGSILVADPTFSMYGITATTLGVSVHSVGRDEGTFAIDVEAANQILNGAPQPAVRLLFVVHPNSPTGNALTPAEIDWLRHVPESVLVVIDEAYFEFSGTSLLTEMPQHPNWVILRTFSKAFRLASHRVGYAISHPELVATLDKIRLPYNLPSLSQSAALLALEHAPNLLEVIGTITAERDRLYQALQQCPSLQVWPSAANLIFARLTPEAVAQSAQSAEEAAIALFQSLKTQGTLIRYIAGGFRITVGTPEENQRTLTRLTATLQRLSLAK
ncbi:MAG: histidinol-phosphate transaminase [Kaiparowitsia implicata GSE-PSE-MK54-09C]|jgi:histidinol-phosphate aminotransferase|nr:histidinol-phosphate transaminase [Kaiparowitsia implicata GSE-PSE-MK54-09C]